MRRLGMLLTGLVLVSGLVIGCCGGPCRPCGPAPCYSGCGYYPASYPYGYGYAGYPYPVYYR